MQAVRHIKCAWDDRFDVQAYFLGWPPPIWPFDVYWGAYAMGIQATDCLGDAGANPEDATRRLYQYVTFDVTYATPGPDDPRPYPVGLSLTKHYDQTCAYSERFEPTMDAIRLDYTLFKWASDGTPLLQDEAPIMTQFRMKYSLSRHYLLTVPAAFTTCIYKCNSASFSPIDIPGWTFAAYTMLFQPPVITPTRDPQGNVRFDVDMAFAYREETWRKYWRATLGGYDSIVLRSGAAYNFPAAASFADLLP